MIHPQDIKRTGNSKYSEDRIFIKCGSCGAYMDYVRSLTETAGGKWVCLSCGIHVRETTVNRYIENLPSLIDDDYDDIY